MTQRINNGEMANVRVLLSDKVQERLIFTPPKVNASANYCWVSTQPTLLQGSGEIVSAIREFRMTINSQDDPKLAADSFGQFVEKVGTYGWVFE